MLLVPGMCDYDELGALGTDTPWKVCTSTVADPCQAHGIVERYQGFGAWKDLDRAKANCARWEGCEGFYLQNNGNYWALDAAGVAGLASEFAGGTGVSQGAWKKTTGFTVQSCASLPSTRTHAALPIPGSWPLRALGPSRALAPLSPWSLRALAHPEPWAKRQPGHRPDQGIRGPRGDNELLASEQS